MFPWFMLHDLLLSIDSVSAVLNIALSVLQGIIREWCHAMTVPRGGDTSMAGMAIAIPGILNISKTGDTMGKIR